MSPFHAFEIVFYLILGVILLVALLVPLKALQKKGGARKSTSLNGSEEARRSPGKRQTVSDDGHVVPRREDITCGTAYGHNHPEQPRYIVHSEPEEGYVILNGVKRKIKDCSNL